MRKRMVLFGFMAMLFFGICLVKHVDAADMGTVKAEYTMLDAQGNTIIVEKSFDAEIINSKEYIYDLCEKNAPEAEYEKPLRTGWNGNIVEIYQEDESEPIFWNRDICEVYMKEKYEGKTWIEFCYNSIDEYGDDRYIEEKRVYSNDTKISDLIKSAENCDIVPEFENWKFIGWKCANTYLLEQESSQTIGDNLYFAEENAYGGGYFDELEFYTESDNSLVRYWIYNETYDGKGSELMKAIVVDKGTVVDLPDSIDNYVNLEWWVSEPVIAEDAIVDICCEGRKIEQPEEQPNSGSCGDGVTWKEENGVLTIDGNGAMTNYFPEGTPPWSDNVEKVIVNEGVTSISPVVFGWLPLIEYEVSENNPNYCSVDGVLYSKDKKVLVQYPSEKEGSSIVIPNGVIEIEKNAFQNNYKINKVVLPDSLITIGKQAFYGCEHLKEIDLGKGVKNIDDLAFAFTQLSEVRIPGSVQNIGGRAFGFLSGTLKKVVVEEGVKKVGDYAFTEDIELEEVSLPSTLTEIGEAAFSGCRGIRSISLPRNLRVIGSRAFDGCTFTEIVLPENLTTIGERAFFGCYNLMSLTIPKSVTTIGEYAFGYKWAEEGTERIGGVKIRCYGGTEGINYAKRNRIPYELLGKAVPVINASNVVKTVGFGSFNLGISYSAGPLTYMSGNTKIAKVDSNGNVTLSKNAVGSVTITVTSPETEEFEALNKKITLTVNPKGTILKNVKALSGRKISVSWKKNSSIDGYEIQYSTKKTFDSGVKKVSIKKNKILKKSITKLKKKKTYYVRIMTYKKADGKKYYSVWSKAKKVKVK